MMIRRAAAPTPRPPSQFSGVERMRMKQFGELKQGGIA
jgi:hypothetical protein